MFLFVLVSVSFYNVSLLLVLLPPSPPLSFFQEIRESVSELTEVCLTHLPNLLAKYQVLSSVTFLFAVPMILDRVSSLPQTLFIGQTPKSGIPPNVAPKIVTPENYLQIWDSSATLIGQLAIVTLFGAILGGIPLSGAYP